MTNTFSTLARTTTILACIASLACGKDKSGEMQASADSLAKAGSAPSMANGASATATTPASNMSDANIVAVVGMANASEIAEGKMAESKASNADVKSFAKLLVTDHSAMQKSMDELAKKDTLKSTPPSNADSMKTAAKQASDSLSKLKGAAFDKAFVAHEVAGHQQTLDALRSFQSSAQNADLKKALGDAMTKVQDHLTKAQQLQSKLGS